MTIKTFCLVILAGAATSSFAQVTYYSNQGAWDAAVEAPTAFGFSGIAPIGSATYFGSGGPTINGFSFSGPAETFVVDNNFSAPYYGTAPVFSDQQNDDPTINISVPGGVDAVGLLLQAWDSPAATITVNGGLPDAFTVSLAPNDPGFFGVTDTSPITSISLSDPGGYVFNLQTVFYGTGASTTPSPGAIIPFGLGLLGAIRRRRS